MLSPLLIIQSQVDHSQLEQAFDTAIVAAIFHNSCRLMSYLEKSRFIQFCETASLQEKLTQLRELNADLVFSSDLDLSECRELIEKAPFVLTF